MDGQALSELDGHVVILNVNEKVGRIVDEIFLGSAGEPPDIVIVIQDRALFNRNPDWHPQRAAAGRVILVDGCPAEPGDLEAVGIGRARAAVILADPAQGQLADAHSTLVAVAIERGNPQVHTVIELISSVNRIHLRSTEVNEVVCLGELAEQLIAQSCITPGVANVLDSLLHAHPGTTQIFVIDLTEEQVGKTYREIARQAIIDQAPHIVCGFVLNGSASAGEPLPSEPENTLVLNPRAGFEPGKDTRLEPGDRLVVVSY